ncbi:MAG: hypothetical protein H7X71_06100 [Chitinophagales bacterium]|nr:hypothetical protein [Chitinophagales bacterium]
MENADIIQDLIDRFLRGEMTSQEKNSFLQQVDADTELKAEFLLQQEIYKGLHYAGNTALKMRLNKMHNEMPPVVIVHSKPETKIISMKMLWRAAAVILLFLIPAYFFFFNSPSADRLYKQYYTAYETNLTARGSNEALLLEIDDLYHTEDYAGALKKINMYSNADTIPAQLLLMKGICEMETGNDKAAHETFNVIIERNDMYHTDHALWYTALLELRAGNKEKCKELLHQLLAGSNPDHEVEAKELLRKL